MVQGKHYVCGIRGVKLVHEAMSHLYLTAAGIYEGKGFAGLTKISIA